MDQDERLKRHLIDLAGQAERRYCFVSGGFLSLAEQEAFTRLLPSFRGVKAFLYGGHEGAERCIPVFIPEELLPSPEAGPAPGGRPPFPEGEDPLTVLLIEPVNRRFAEELTHRDYLGAILNLGIDRSLTGDILVKEDGAYLFCLKSIAPFLSESLTRVRNTSVRLSEVSFDLPALRPEFETLRVNVASERFDAVLSALTKLSRGKTAELFRQQRVQVNGRITEDPDHRLKEGDVISIRGFGKAIYEGISGESRKGRLYVELKKYV
ncbi:MAG: hypothetical protein IJM76_07870 [Lachnospiraceae bacterium]|nr:hypothetical protein [Lachnospiraceae bacterium]